jgi:mannosylglycerate hydrolase
VGSHGGLGGPWYKIIFLAELPALGWATYYLCDGDGSDEPEEVFVEAFDSYLQNDVVRVDVQPNGALRVTDRSSGHIYSNINLLEDMADLGDGWEFGPLPADEPINSLQVEARSVLRAATPAYSELHVSYELAIPESLAEGRTARATEEVLLPVDVFIRLLPGNDPAVYIETRIRNVACDHCVRALFPTGVRADTIAVNGHFGVLHRPTEPPSTKGWKHPWVMNQTQPFHQWVSVFDAAASAGAALLTKGLPAYEIEKTGEDAVVLALVLYRATGQWGHHLTVRPPVLTPDAQLFDKELTFEYAFVPQSISWDQAGVSRLAQRLNAPIHLEEDYDAFRLKVQPKNKCLPPISSLLSIGVPEVVLSALMLAGESTLLVRVYNISPNEMLCPIRCGFPFKTVQLVNALREVLPSQEELVQTGEEQELALTIGPSRIATLEFTF